MTERAKIIVPQEVSPPPPPGVECFTSGSTLLDLIIADGGGWALGRIGNIVGDKSTGKTLIAIEAFANFIRLYPSGKMRYGESEAAFDDIYADQVGFPPSVERPEDMLHTVEEFRDDFAKFINRLNGKPGLYVLDSLDALSDDAEVAKFEKELKKKTDPDPDDNTPTKGSFGVGKAKEMSKLFRLLTQMAREANCTLIIISQIRDNIGVAFGEKHVRSGGKALDFYCSQVVWLAEVSKITRTSKGIQRVVGVQILAKCKKCKVGYPFRTAEMFLTFGYGIDNELSLLEWLKDAKAIVDETYKTMKASIADAREKQDYKLLAEIEQQLKKDVISIWKEVDKNLAPTVKKYREAGA